MAKVTVEELKPTPPPPKKFVVELNEREAGRLMALLYVREAYHDNSLLSLLVRAGAQRDLTIEGARYTAISIVD